MTRSITLATVGLACVTACGTDTTMVRIVDRVLEPGVESEDGYTTKDVTLSTIDVLREVRGQVATFHGSANISIDAALSNPADAGASCDEIIRGGQAPQAQWIAVGDTAVATSYDALMMFTGYAHLETASAAFSEIGVTELATLGAQVYYEPAIQEHSAGPPGEDNAIYFQAADAILMLPHNVLQEIPFAMNLGVMAHELSHRVFYYEAWDARLLEYAARFNCPSADEFASFNLITATDEGLADYLGAWIMNDPNFIDYSIDDRNDGIARARDLSVQRILESSDVDGLDPTAANSNNGGCTSGPYDPYRVGAILASSLWAVAEQIGGDRVAAAVIRAQRNLTGALHGALDYELGDFEVEFVAELVAGDQPIACSVFQTTYAVIASRLDPVCP